MRAIASKHLVGIAAAATLAACSANETGGSDQTSQPASSISQTPAESVTADATSARREALAAPAGTQDPEASAKLPVSLPKLAYSYALSYLLPGDKVAAAQDAHRDLCEEMGPARCQLLGLERGVAEGGSSNARLRLRVATADARRFQILLDHEVTQVGGRADDAKIATDEVSKQVVDTEARIRQRELLVARLTEMLRKRNGRVPDLLAAERNITEAQEELDQARSWLGELKGRVAMSDFEIRYAAIAPSASPQQLGTWLGEAAQGSGAVFQVGLRFILSLAIYLLPWLVLLGLPVLAIRALRRRRVVVQG